MWTYFALDDRTTRLICGALITRPRKMRMKQLLGGRKQLTRLAGEHDRVVRGVDPLLAELSRRFAQLLPRLLKILR